MGPCCWGSATVVDDMRPWLTCAIQTQACVVTFGSQEVLIHAGIMHAGRLWHRSPLPCSRAHLFGNGFTYIFFSMALPLPLPRLTALAHTDWVNWKPQTCSHMNCNGGHLGGAVRPLSAMFKVFSWVALVMKSWLCCYMKDQAFAVIIAIAAVVFMLKILFFQMHPNFKTIWYQKP